MRITVVSFYAVTNIGDKILADCACKILHDLGHDTFIADINGRSIIYEGDDEETRNKKIFHSKCIEKDRSLFSAYYKEILSNTNCLIFVGGAILDVLSDGVAENILSIVEIAQNLRVPVAFSSVGFYGNLTHTPKGKVIQKALLNPIVKWISVREHSEEMKILLDGKKTFSVCCDPAVWARETYHVDNPQKAKKVGINIVNDSYYSKGNKFAVGKLDCFYTEVYERLLEAGFDCYFFINGVRKDYDYAVALLRKYGISRGKLYGLEYSKNGEIFCSMLSSFSLIISSRLHSSITAYSLIIPALCLPWDEKMIFFYKNIQKEDLLIHQDDTKIIDSIAKRALQTKFDDEWYHTYRQSILTFIDNICNQIASKKEY